MKVVLVYPTPVNALSVSRNKDRSEIDGVGLLYLATVIKHNHDVVIIGGAEKNPPSTEEIIRRVTEMEPDLLGISTVFSSLMASGQTIAAEIRKRLPRTKIVFGGNHATFIADKLAATDYTDAVVLGEGEMTFKELVEKFDSGKPIDEVKGIVFRKDGKVIRTPPRPPIKDIDGIPFPDWRLVYDRLPRGIPMCSSRGCPHDCIYCSTTAYWGRKWRARSARNMVDEIKHVFDLYSSDTKKLNVGFVDDNFTVNRKRVIEFCRLLREEDLDITWGASSRIELLDEELVEILADSGCEGLFFGVESGSERVLQSMNRHYTPDEARAKVDLCVRYGIEPTCSFMVGNPYEDKDDVEKTFALLKTLRSYKVQVHVFTPLLGTEIFTNSGKYGVEIFSEDWDTMQLEGKANLNTRHLTAKEIESLYHKGVGLVLKRYREQERVRKIVAVNKQRRKERLLSTGEIPVRPAVQAAVA